MTLLAFDHGYHSHPLSAKKRNPVILVAILVVILAVIFMFESDMHLPSTGLSALSDGALFPAVSGCFNASIRVDKEACT